MRLRTILLLLPVVVFALVALAFYRGLYMENETLPSALLDKPAPEFALEPPPGADRGFSTDDLKSGKVSLVNVFASWCVPCHAEHPLLMRLAQETDIPIYGLNVKDEPADVEHFLVSNGNPYTGVGADREGRVSIDWGVYGYPETFVVDGDGTILYRHVGQITPETLENTILPLVRQYDAKDGAQQAAVQ